MSETTKQLAWQPVQIHAAHGKYCVWEGRDGFHAEFIEKIGTAIELGVCWKIEDARKLCQAHADEHP